MCGAGVAGDLRGLDEGTTRRAWGSVGHRQASGLSARATDTTENLAPLKFRHARTYAGYGCPLGIRTILGVYPMCPDA